MRCIAAEASIAPWVDCLSTQHADVMASKQPTARRFGPAVSCPDSPPTVIRPDHLPAAENSREGNCQ
jgi:hypothetical protein